MLTRTREDNRTGPRYFIWTIGCQMNKAESERIAGYLDSAGCRATGWFSDADLVILNTCVVRQSAENKALGTLGLLKGLKDEHPGLRIVVTGCLVDSDSKDLSRRFPQVDFAFRPGDFRELVEWGHDEAGLVGGELRLPETCSPCAYIPIMQGCDNFCSYCIVPYRRGREVSRPLEDILCEAEQLVEHGAVEVTLLGQNVDSYGHDLPEGPDLAELLTQLEGIDGIARIRFLTNHPKDINPKLIETVASASKVCEHLQLPVQAGDDDILRAMRRGYTVERYRELVRTIRRHIPHVSLSTDVIVGFPGETETQFEHTCSLLEEIEFDVVHVAAYSPRPDTAAARELEDDVPSHVKKQRLNRVESVQADIASRINSQLQGKIVEVLVEGKKKGRWFGRTRSDKLVFFDDAGDWLGRLVEVQIDNASPWSLKGQVSTNS